MTRKIDGSAIAERLVTVRANIAAACDRAGRDTADVTLIGVSKTQPVEAVRAALDAGLDDFGENRAQELLSKAEAAAEAGLRPRWQFIGHLQRNKVRQLLPHIVALHSLDSVRLAEELERRATAPVPCYLEVNVAGETSKEGVAVPELPSLLRDLTSYEHVSVVGLMTVAPQVCDPEEVRPVFARLRALAESHGLAGLSMGMTEDYEVAIEEGSTAVRVGRAIFGPRQA